MVERMTFPWVSTVIQCPWEGIGMKWVKCFPEGQSHCYWDIRRACLVSQGRVSQRDLTLVKIFNFFLIWRRKLKDFWLILYLCPVGSFTHVLIHSGMCFVSPLCEHCPLTDGQCIQHTASCPLRPAPSLLPSSSSSLDLSDIFSDPGAKA